MNTTSVDHHLPLLLALALVASHPGCAEEGEGDAGPECEIQGPDDIGGGCPTGQYCAGGECTFDCVSDDQCLEVYGLYWVCSQFGQCVPDESAGGDADADADTDVDADTDADADTDCSEGEEALCSEAFVSCYSGCDVDAGPGYDECVDACRDTYCECVVDAGCDPADYDCPPDSDTDG